MSFSTTGLSIGEAGCHGTVENCFYQRFGRDFIDLKTQVFRSQKRVKYAPFDYRHQYQKYSRSETFDDRGTLSGRPWSGAGALCTRWSRGRLYQSPYFEFLCHLADAFEHTRKFFAPGALVADLQDHFPHATR